MIERLTNKRGDGSGREGRLPIVLVAGWSFDSSMWRDLVDEFVFCGGDRSAIHCLDWLAFGQWIFDGSDCPVAEDFGANNAIWLGWSLGGALILEALSRKKLTPHQSIILSASPRFLQDTATGWQGVPKKNWQALRRQVGRSPDAALVEFDRWLGLPAGFGRQREAGLLQQGLDWLATTDLREWSSGTEAPIHWIFGADDPLLPNPSWTNAYGAVGHQFTSLRGCGHDLPWSQDAYLVRQLQTFSILGNTDV